MPGLVEADDDGLYVLKFRAAGQGVKALVAEVMAGEVARALGLPVPELVLVELDPEIGRAEPDPEIQHLLRGSPGLNLGMDFLPGALAYGPERRRRAVPGARGRRGVVRRAGHERRPHPAQPEPAALARAPVADRPRRGAVRPPRQLDPVELAERPFPAIRDHVLLPGAGSIADADERLAGRIDAGRLDAIVAAIPEPGSRAIPPRGAACTSTTCSGGSRRRELRGGGRACPSRRVARSSTRSCGSCRAWSAASASTRAS